MNWNSDGLGHLRAGPLHNPIPPDEPDYLDETCDQCQDQAIEQAQYDEMLCEQHYRDTVLWDAADEMNQVGWEE